MNPSQRHAKPLLRSVLAALAAVVLPAGSVSAQSITNPSFEADTFTVDPGLVSANSPVTGWTGNDPTKYGLNPAATNSLANNGTVPNGTKVAFILTGGSMSTTITGLTADTTYKVSFRSNAPALTPAHNPIMRISTDGVGATVDARANASGAAGTTLAYKYIDYEFKATGASHVLTVANVQTGTNTLLIDDFSVGVSAGKWSFRRVTGDADSGIDSQYFYSHATTFGGAPNPYLTTVNGVTFLPVTGANPSLTGRLATTGYTASFGEALPGSPGGRNVTGSSNLIYRSFNYGAAMTITVSNLKPNTAYVATIYGLGWDVKPYGRASTFSSNLEPNNRLTVDLDQFDQKSGLAVDYAYTTDNLGSAVVINCVPAGDSSFHTSAFSNREAVASPPPASVWSQAPWTNDTTSGVDGTYLYTHAYNFANAAAPNLNGVPFTAVNAVNPTVAGKFTTSGLPSPFNNDANNLTTVGSRLLANDFVYGGFPATFNLSGLTAGKEYVFTIYSVGWEAPGARKAYFQSAQPGHPLAQFDQDAYGDNNGVRFECRYTAPASGTASFSTFPSQNASIHTYGFSNREALQMVNTAPVITLHPTGGSVEQGGTYTFRAGATGSPALTYVWQRNDVDIPNSNSPTLTISPVTSADQGTYKVIVSNGSGSPASNPAVLTVLDGVPGLFDTGVGPNKLALADGQTDPHYTLITNPDGAGLIPPFVQTAIPGAWLANSASSKWIGPRVNTIAATGESVDAGAGLGIYVYRTTFDLTGFDRSTVVITGGWACDNGGTAIRVNGTATGLTNTAQFGSLTSFTINSSNATFVDGLNTLDFYVRNETVAAGYTGLRVSGIKGLGVIPAGTAPYIAFGPADLVLKHNATGYLGVSASGSAPLSYKWYKDDVLLPSETASVLTLTATSPAVAGSFKVSVTNGVTTVTSAPAAVTAPNAAPVTVTDGLAASKNTPVPVSAASLTANDTDADLDVITVTSVGAASAQGGTVSLSVGTVTYTPAAGFTGSDSFTYTVNDGWGGTTAGTVQVTVIDGQIPGLLEIVPSRTGGQQNLRFRGVAGTAYHLERSIDLAVWEEIDLETAPPSGIIEFQDAAPPNERAYYRISW